MPTKYYNPKTENEFQKLLILDYPNLWFVLEIIRVIEHYSGFKYDPKTSSLKFIVNSINEIAKKLIFELDYEHNAKEVNTKIMLLYETCHSIKRIMRQEIFTDYYEEHGIDVGDAFEHALRNIKYYNPWKVESKYYDKPNFNEDTLVDEYICSKLKEKGIVTLKDVYFPKEPILKKYGILKEDEHLDE